jgi:hypothetical protein
MQAVFTLMLIQQPGETLFEFHVSTLPSLLSLYRVMGARENRKNRWIASEKRRLSSGLLGSGGELTDRRDKRGCGTG